jgi:hypothetical protein
MIDDDDLAGAAAVFEAAPRALHSVELPHRREALQHRGATHACLQLFDFLVMPVHCYCYCPFRLAGQNFSCSRYVLVCRLLSGNREAGAG